MGKKCFKDEISKMYIKKEKNEIIKAIDKGIEEDIIYLALRDVYLIAYNAPLVKQEGKVAGIFQYEDINKAKQSFDKLVKEYVKVGFKKEEALNKSFDIIKNYYMIVATPKEKSERTGMIKNNNQDSYFHGTCYNFNEIPDETWNEIEKQFREI